MNYVEKFQFWEGQSPSLMARVRKGDGTYLLQADVKKIQYEVTELINRSDVASGTLEATDVVYDALQTDDRWKKDGTGFNFCWRVPRSVLGLKGAQRYLIEIIITTAGPTEDEQIPLVYSGDQMDLRTWANASSQSSS